MYTHEKNIALKRYLKIKAASLAGLSTDACELDQLSNVVEIFDTNKMNDMLELHSNKSNLYRNHQRFISYLGDTDGFLPMATIPCSIVEKLDDLQLSFPNFVDVISHYREQIALSQLTAEESFSATPLLISGPPGVGKTAFCRALAHIMQTHFEWIGMSGVTAGFVLGGMSSNWADGKPGKIVESLARGKKSNPLILIDEIDKVGGDHRYDPLGSLYQLLEKETAVNFIDEGLEMSVNCSHIVWVATANELMRIPEPILSRFAVLEVRQPDRSQMGKVLQSIYSKVLKEHCWGGKFTEQLNENVIDKVISSGLAPRLIQRELISACGRAALTKHRANGDCSYYELAPDDFQPRSAEAQEYKIGFVQ
ncbi:MAG: AAA family ATPase [Methylobacter sp.]